MTINAGGNVFVTGTTTSKETSSADQFPATNVPQSVPYQAASKAAPGLPQFFITKINPAAGQQGSIPYSTYFGGGTYSGAAPIAVGGGIAVDTANNVYFTGTTSYIFAGCAGCSTTDFPILNAFQPCLDTAPPASVGTSPSCSNTTATESDAFVAKLNLNPNVPQGLAVGLVNLPGRHGDRLEYWSRSGFRSSKCLRRGDHQLHRHREQHHELTTSQSFQSCLDTPLNPTAGTACTAPASPAPDDAFVARLSNPATSTTGSATNVTLTYFSYLGEAARIPERRSQSTMVAERWLRVRPSHLTFLWCPLRTPFNLLLVVCKTPLLRAFTRRRRPAKPRVPGPVTSVAAARMQVAESRWT